MGSDRVLTGRKILVTGGTGYLGSWMAELARRAGNDVRLLVRRVPDHLGDWARGFDVVTGDIRRRETLADAFDDREVVWHTASMNETRSETDVAGAIETNVVGTSNALEAALAARVSVFVKFSTFHIYGHSGPGAIGEDAPTAPRSVYGLTHLMGDECARFYGARREIGIRIPRLSNGYGAPLSRAIDRWSLVVNDLARTAFENKEIVLRSSGRQHRDFVSIQDVFDAISLLSEVSVDENTFNVGGGGSRSIMDVARLTQSVYRDRYGVEIPIQAPDPAPGEHAEPVAFEIPRLSALGYRPQDRMAEEIDAIFQLLESS